ncbi:DNA cytosine methyltransferase [Qipengyuania sediminis]|uniref:DNA cytosine methyltransferase n=1 Tax=Qipengyuania sediminis TaxID=1532023 RepID=UPI0023EA5AE8|nr:DNA cytosine methyltransferase [Qipengyuania sediminis]
MGRKPRRPRAIDLYSGVGGWSLGLRLAGVDVVASYEKWGPANETNFKNNSHQAQTVDIRRLALADLPSDIDIVVGSPPCTQFSFSNRGGGGDIADGLEDVKRFLTIVDHLKPRIWAMENVPRVAKIIEAELQKGGALEEFASLGCVTHIIDMADYGLPQRRRRCIAGNFNIGFLESYRSAAEPRLLGDVIRALKAEPVVDPIFGISLPRKDLTDHVEEDVLNSEEVRINRANKTTHTVYNAMPFPDPLDRTVRTITATCTRVSRESIVIATGSDEDEFRRLTLRERASLQGFPITFQFYGASYGQKLRMIGNAVPPAFAYLMGHALQGNPADIVPPLPEVAKELVRPVPAPTETPADRAGARYPATRTFRFAIPSLQLKSGVRFEFRNDNNGPGVKWEVAFYFGTSKAIQSLTLDRELARRLTSEMSTDLADAVNGPLDDLGRFMSEADVQNLQTVWAHRGPGGTRPFMVLDKLSEAGSRLIGALANHNEESQRLIISALEHEYGDRLEDIPGVAKLQRNPSLILAGLLIASRINPILAAHVREEPGETLGTSAP